MRKMKMTLLLVTGLVLLSGCSVFKGSSGSKEWTLVWNDEFNYKGAPDPDKWSYELGNNNGWGNDELENYTNSDTNSYVDGDHLVISAVKEDNKWTSARIRTLGKGEWKYGRYEIRAKLPSGVGTWPAIWMLPSKWVYGGWPDSGEIDIMEHVGRDLNKVFGTLHTAKYNHNTGTGKGKTIQVDNATNEYHTYAIEWYPNEMKFFVDDNNYYSYQLNEKLDGGVNYYEAWPFDQDFYLILNLAMGGKFGGSIDQNLSYAEMDIDYVRVYQYTAKDTEKPSTPVINLDNTRISSNQINLDWDESTDNTYIESYEVYLNDVLATTSSFSFAALTDLTANTDYNVKVVAVDTGGNKTSSDVVKIKTLDYPQAPGKIDATMYTEKTGGRIVASADEDSGDAIANLKKNQSITYKVNVQESGTYTFKFRISSLDGDADMDIYLNGTKQSTLDLPATGGWRNWQTIETGPIYLNKGMNSIKLVGRMTNMVKDTFWINWMDIEKAN